MIIFDLETSGLDVNKARIVEATFYNTETGEKHYYLLNPQIPIPEQATKIHTITNEMVMNQPTFKDIYKELHFILHKKILVGYNSVNYDTPILINEFKRVGLDFIPFKQIDLYVVWNTQEKTKKLSDAYKRFCNKELINAHRSDNDVSATEEILNKQIELWDIETLLDISMTSPIKKEQIFYMKFGKYKGYTLENVFNVDPGYLKWFYNLEGTTESYKNEIEKIVKNNLS
jgi:DNA polymerase-3 subunit epsilon